METTDNPAKKKWFSIREAAEILGVGDSTRFWPEDLDSVMQVFHSARDVDKAREVCPVEWVRP